MNPEVRKLVGLPPAPKEEFQCSRGKNESVTIRFARVSAIFSDIEHIPE